MYMGEWPPYQTKKSSYQYHRYPCHQRDTIRSSPAHCRSWPVPRFLGFCHWRLQRPSACRRGDGDDASSPHPCLFLCHVRCPWAVPRSWLEPWGSHWWSSCPRSRPGPNWWCDFGDPDPNLVCMTLLLLLLLLPWCGCTSTWCEDDDVDSDILSWCGLIAGLACRLEDRDRGLRRLRISLSVPLTISTNWRHLSMNSRLGLLSSKPGYSLCVVSMASPMRPSNTSLCIPASQYKTSVTRVTRLQLQTMLTTWLSRQCHLGSAILWDKRCCVHSFVSISVQQSWQLFVFFPLLFH